MGSEGGSTEIIEYDSVAENCPEMRTVTYAQVFQRLAFRVGLVAGCIPIFCARGYSEFVQNPAQRVLQRAHQPLQGNAYFARITPIAPLYGCAIA